MPPTYSPNFDYLAHHDPRLAILGTQAETYFADDPNTCLIKLRQFGEVLAKRAAAKLGLYGSSIEESQADLVFRLYDRGAFDSVTKRLFTDLRLTGNKATHEVEGTHTEALHQLKIARELGIWFQRSFGNHRKFDPGPFVPPPGPKQKEDDTLAKQLETLRAELEKTKVNAKELRSVIEEEARKRLTAEQIAQKQAQETALWEALASEQAEQRAKDVDALAKQNAQLEAELVTLAAKAAAAPVEAQKAAIARAAAASHEVYLDEAATRRIIDEQLRAVGWEVDSERLTHKRGARPEKNKNRAIAEWPTKNGTADYVLFVGMVPIGVVEAKRLHIDVAGKLDQSTRYGTGFVVKDGITLAGGPWGKLGHQIPFLFATNGRPYLEQIKEKSGIWFRDARRDENSKKPLQGWYSPDGLSALLKQDIEAAHEKLKTEPTDYLGLYDYQIQAIQAVEKAIENGKRSCLVAMATGTGKTRTALGLIYRLIKTKRFRRVLFLVDRSALGEQAADTFKEERLENLQTFADIFDLKVLGEIKPDPDTKLQIATVQSLVKRVLDADAASVPPVDQYDCLIVDECHRGYTLDRELSDAELSFRDFDDYVSKYRRVLDHFDAVKIGLTATPALHTTEIFGDPTFRYSYREAVIDGRLVDHELPIRIVTELAQQGIQWAKGEAAEVYDPHKIQLDLIHLEDEVSIEVDGFNRAVITENFNRVVCEQLANEIDPKGDAKTLIFALNDDHAQRVERLLQEAFIAKYGEIDDDTVKKITGASDKPLQLIRKFKNERLPNVAITVDLLTTGIDVPRICNVVFLRRVKSRILYEQMLGRATRLCPDIGKTVFRIFDAVDLYSELEQYTDMRPVVPSPKTTFAQLVAELSHPDAEIAKLAQERIIAKLRQKAPKLKDEQASRFEGAAGMAPPSLASMLKGQTPREAAAWFDERKGLVFLLDEPTGGMKRVLVSHHEDRLVMVEVGYGKYARPDDYLESFTAFLRENMNKIPALMVVTQRPRDLTRAALRGLHLALDEKGYTEGALQTAWRQTSNVDIAASIIGYIRKAALGNPLISYEERVARATKKILARQSWTSVQRTWLERIGKQIEREKVIDRETVDESEAFKSNGGFKHLDKVFAGQLDTLLGDLREEVWKEVG